MAANKSKNKHNKQSASPSPTKPHHNKFGIRPLTVSVDDVTAVLGDFEWSFPAVKSLSYSADVAGFRLVTSECVNVVPIRHASSTVLSLLTSHTWLSSSASKLRQVVEEAVCPADCHASTTSSVNMDDEELASRTDDRPPTSSSLASHLQTLRPNTSPSTVSSYRQTESPSTISSHSRCSCSRRVTDIRAFAGFYSDGDVDDAVAMETRQQLQRSLRSTTSEGGAFRRVLPSRPALQQRALAPTPRDRERTAATEAKGRRDWINSNGLTGRSKHGGHWLTNAAQNHTMVDGQFRKYEPSDRTTAIGQGTDVHSKRCATSNWVNGLLELHQVGQRRRRGRQVLSVVRCGAGLRAISETGDACRLSANSTSSTVNVEVSHPVIRGLYGQPLRLPASATSSSSSSSSQEDIHRDVDDDSSDESQQSV